MKGMLTPNVTWHSYFLTPWRSFYESKQGHPAAPTKQTNRRQMVKALKYDNPDHKTKLQTRHIQVTVKSTRQIKVGVVCLIIHKLS